MTQPTNDTTDIFAMLMGPVTSRHWAAEVLRKVADAGSTGNFPQDVTCEELGRALERICLNAPMENSFWRVFRSWRKAARSRRQREERSLEELRKYFGH